MNFKSTFDIEILDLLPSLHPPFPHRKKKNIPYKSPHDWQNTRSSSITATKPIRNLIPSLPQITSIGAKCKCVRQKTELRTLCIRRRSP